jgi:hypothetical protein
VTDRDMSVLATDLVVSAPPGDNLFSLRCQGTDVSCVRGSVCSRSWAIYTLLSMNVEKRRIPDMPGNLA